MDIWIVGLFAIVIGIVALNFRLANQNRLQKSRVKSELEVRAEVEAKSAKCPECAELILVEANRCRFCQADVTSRMEPLRADTSKIEELGRRKKSVAKLADAKQSISTGYVFLAFNLWPLIMVFGLGQGLSSFLLSVLFTAGGIGMLAWGTKLRNESQSELGV